MLNLITPLMIWVSVNLFMACSPMDGDSLPVEQFDQVEISDFEVNLKRDYIRGKIQNNSEHDITSSIFKFELYAEKQPSGSETNIVNESSAVQYVGIEKPDASTLLLSQNFVVRESLKPGYSTEFYFELKMDYKYTDFLYTYDIVQLKGD